MKECYLVNIEFENSKVIIKNYLISLEEIKSLGNEITRIDIIKVTKFLNLKKTKYFAVITNRKYIKKIFYNLQNKDDSRKIPIYYSSCSDTDEVLKNYNNYYKKILGQNNKVLKNIKKR